MFDRRNIPMLPAARRRCLNPTMTLCLMAAALLSTSAPGASAGTVGRSAPAPLTVRPGEQDAGTDTLCYRQRPLGRGWLTVSARYRDGRRVGGFTARWETHQVVGPPGADPVKLGFSVDLTDAGTPGDRRVELVLDVLVVDDLPWQSLIWRKRPFPVEPHGVISGAGFVGEVYRTLNNSGGRGQARFPVADLLAYAEGFDALTWQVMRHTQSTVLSPDLPGGRLQTLESGELDVGGLREAWRYIHANRSVLARERLDRTGDCTEMPPEPVLY